MTLTSWRTSMKASFIDGGKAMEKKAGLHGRRTLPWRTALWGGAVLLLLLPAIAMHFTREVRWGAADFFVFGIMLAVACGIFDRAMRATGNAAYRAGVAVAAAAGFLLVWVNLAVGFIGEENNPLNLLYAGVLAIAVIGAFAARFRALGMARAMAAAALAQALAVLPGLAAEPVLLLPTAVFVAFWLLSAWLFRKAAADLRPV